MNYTNYNALSDFDLVWQLAGEGYALLTNDNDELELFYHNKTTGEIFESVQAAHRRVFDL